MKIICVGRNYAEHALELNNELPEEPVIFMKPDSAILRNGQPFFIPNFSSQIHYEIELVVKIERIGKNIAPKFAHRYYSEIGLGIDFTARDLQAKLKAKGLPWEKAKGFDFSAPLGDFVNKQELGDLHNIEFTLQKNGVVVQKGNSCDMITPIDQLIAHISNYFTLKIGDLIFTGTPSGVGPVAIGDHLEGFIGNRKLIELNVK